jgi:hypothetical protein
MGEYERKARHALERIEYFYNNAGPRGYSQAMHYYNELAKLLMGARHSKKNKGDAGIIASFREQADPLMKEMKNLQDEWEKQESEQKKE